MKYLLAAAMVLLFAVCWKARGALGPARPDPGEIPADTLG